MKKIIIFLLCALFSLNVFAQPNVQGTVLESWTNPPDHVVIPEGVLTIKAQCFFNKTNIISVNTNDVTEIESGSFRCCTALETALMPNVTTLNARALQETKLKNLSLPNVITVGPYAFSSSEHLEYIELPLVQFIERGAFDKCLALKTVDLSKAADLTRVGTTAHPDQLPFPNIETLTVYVNDPVLFELFWNPSPEERLFTLTDDIPPVTNVENMILSPILSIYPNPAKNEVTVQTNDLINNNIKLYSATGMLVMETVISNNKTNLHVSNLDRNTYFVCVGSKTQKLMLE